MIKTVKAKKVREGDFIPGLDNAYVFRVSTEEGYNGNETTIIMHDAEGNEAELTCWSKMPITVKRD